jgi:hypothetical protein
MIPETKDRPAKIVMLPALAMYLALAAWSAVRNADQINPDGVCYIRLAGYLAGGRATDSISSYWSPLISWCMAPLLAVGIDGLHAARAVLLIWGAVFVLASGALIMRFTVLPPLWGALALALVAAATVHWTIWITPDVILAACLMAYFSCVTHGGLLRSRRQQFLAGICGGVACLAKAYALPFFLVHFPSAIALRYFLQRREDRIAGRSGEQERASPFQAAAAWAVGMFGLALICGPWIGAVSWKEGRFTFSSAARANHAIVGPPDVQRNHPMLFGLWTAPAGRITVWEVPETLPYRDWSPFENAEYRSYAIDQVLTNASKIKHILSQGDLFGLSLFMLGASPVLLYLLRRQTEQVFRILWYAGTVLLYCSGYALVVVEDRYIKPILWPVGCFCCLHFAWLLRERLCGAGQGQSPRRDKTGPVLAAALLVAFGLAPGIQVVKDLKSRSSPAYRAIGQKLAAAGFRGPVASTRFDEGLYVAYHMNQPFLGGPQGKTPEQCEQELNRQGAKVFLVWHDWPLRKLFSPGPSWTLARTMEGLGPTMGGPVDVYVRSE